MLFISELHFLPCFMRSNVIPYLPLCHCTWHESGFDPSCSMRDHRHKQTFPLLGCHFFISCNLSHRLVAREIALTYCHTHTSLSQSNVFGIICVRLKSTFLSGSSQRVQAILWYTRKWTSHNALEGHCCITWYT